MKTEDIPESEVQVKIARCPKCKNPVKVSIAHLMDKESKRELASLVNKDGCDVETVSLTDFRSIKDFKFCHLKH